MMKSKYLLTLLFVIAFNPSHAQTTPDDADPDQPQIRKTGFTAGISIGTYFANNNTASLYDGYGFDANGDKNNFDNSWMNQKINVQYADNNPSGIPYIADALGVQPGEWTFGESDMPYNMRYKTSLTVGFAGRYSVDGRNAVLLNVIAAQLTASGNFSIVTRPPANSTQINNSIRTCNIRGQEQRLLFQAGYQRLLGENQDFCLVAEGGLHATLAKFNESEIQIEDLQINLLDNYYNPNSGYTFFTGSKPVRLGFGAFTGLGFNIDTGNKWLLQLMYNLNLENVRIAYSPKLALNNALSLRAYYRL